MPDQTDHPPEYKQCDCSRLCNGGRWVHRRTHARHKQYRTEDIARRREQRYAKVTGSAYPGTLATSHAPSSYHPRIAKVRIPSLFA